MRSFCAFAKKELTEQLRSGKLLFLGLLFLLFGIMNPAVAKLTPWLLEIMADSLADSGMTVTSVTITAMDSWTQFYKNIPMALIAFLLLESSIFTKEYADGTLILSLTKGLARYKVVASKAVVLSALWGVGYWLCYGITYGYNAYFWDNAIARALLFSALCWWLFGQTVICLLMLFSALFTSNAGVLFATGFSVLVSWLLGLLPKCSKYLPTFLADGNSLIHGIAEPQAYMPALWIALAICVLCLILSIPIFHKKQL